MFEDVIKKLCISMELGIISEIEILKKMARLRIAWDLYDDEFIVVVRQDGENSFYLYHELLLCKNNDVSNVREFIESRGLYASYDNNMDWIIAKGLDNSEQLYFALIEMIKLCTQIEALDWKKG